ncbi:Serpin B6 [Halotydeus destructor]|nr:Serpin B6 [Halotydeus destructor]
MASQLDSRSNSNVPVNPRMETADNANVIDVKESANAFALQFFRTFVNRHADNYVNLFTSPFVVFTALASILVGARTTTKEQLEKILRLKDFMDNPANTNAFSNLTNKVFRLNSDFIFVGNFLYYDESLTLTKQFKETLKNVFESKPKKLNFRDTQIDKQIKAINDDMKRETEGVVDEVVDEQEVTRNVKLLLVNSILFRGYWESAFTLHKEQQTFSYSTMEDHNQSAPVDMMWSLSVYKYCDVPALKAKAVLLPYEGSDLQMLVILPDDPKVDGVNIFNDLNLAVYKGIFESMAIRKVEVTLPVFSLDPNKVSIKGTLEVMGAGGVFRKGADFSGLTDSPGIYLSKLAHKAFILADAKGATVSEKAYQVKKLANDEPIKFRADHPFAFMIIDATNILILMVGYFGDPRETLEVVHESQLTQAEKEALLADIRSNK